MTCATHAMAEMLEKQVPLLESEGFFETALEASIRARLLRFLAALELQ